MNLKLKSDSKMFDPIFYKKVDILSDIDSLKP